MSLRFRFRAGRFENVDGCIYSSYMLCLLSLSICLFLGCRSMCLFLRVVFFACPPFVFFEESILFCEVPYLITYNQTQDRSCPISTILVLLAFLASQCFLHLPPLASVSARIVKTSPKKQNIQKDKSKKENLPPSRIELETSGLQFCYQNRHMTRYETCVIAN